MNELQARVFRRTAMSAAALLMILTVAMMPPLARAAPGEWAWMSGSNDSEKAGVYGTKGVASAANVPGSRMMFTGMSWTDSAGKLWLFGGFGRDSGFNIGYLNDLWCFDPGNGFWTWMGGSSVRDQAGVYGTKGVASASNMPGGRRAAAGWTTGDGSFWLFGGVGWSSFALDMGRLNDLWRRDPDTGLWTWVSGSDLYNQAGVYGTKGVAHADNRPGGREAAVSWTAADGTLWLLGGYGRDAAGAWGRLDDLWKFNPASGLWTWVGGTGLANQTGFYGSMGSGAAANRPGGRQDSATWVDASGRLWLFGGFGYAAGGSQGYLNDLWRFDPVGGVWTWVGGSTVINQNGFYGTLETPAASNQPGARSGCGWWLDETGNLCLFGGGGYASTGSFGYLNDLWRLDPAGLWTWMGGSHLINDTGVYGTKGVPHPDNIPGARGGGVFWNDGNGNLWTFGGHGRYISTIGRRNDLWRFTLPVPPLPPRITGLHRSGASGWEIHWTGNPGDLYQLQEATTLEEASFTDTGAPLTCNEGTNITPREASGPRWFWRLRKAP